MSDFAQIVCMVLAIDFIVSLVVGISVFSNAEYFWDKARDWKRQSVQSVLLANGYIFLFCAFFFFMIHVWAWAPFNISAEIVPFEVTWQFAIVLAFLPTLGWALPMKRAMAKIQKVENKYV